MLLLDMDGVIVNFTLGMFRAHNKPFHEITHWNYFEDWGITEEQFWEPANHEFWANLEWTFTGRNLLSGLVGLVGIDNIVLCSTPGPNPGACDGKLDWIRKHAPAFQRRFMFTPVKEAAAKGNILIDDSDSNCEKFEKAGGKAVLFPRTWNKRREETIWGECSPNLVLEDVANEIRRD
jgi:5'(3')-deoxyribonucleotidase